MAESLPKARHKLVKSQENAMISASRHWTASEMERLTEALKKYGSSDMEKVSEYVGTRTANEVRHLIRQKKNFIRKYQQPGDDETQAPNIHHWCEVVHKAIDSYSRAKEFSTVLSEIMQALSKEHSEEFEEVDFGKIYTYLHSILAGTIPPVPGPAESLIIINIVKDLSLIFKLNSFDQERELLRNLHKRPTDPVPEELKVPAFAGKRNRKEDKRKRKWRLLRDAQIDDSSQNSLDSLLQEPSTSSSSQPQEHDTASTSTSMDVTPKVNDTVSTVSSDSNTTSVPSTSEQRDNLEIYPIHNLQQHSYKMVVYSTNPLQIPVEFVTKTCEFINASDA